MSQTSLYKWDSEEQINQFQQYLVQSTPTTSSLLGYFISYDYFATSHGVDAERIIWSSHPDPFNTKDIVVWVIESNKSDIRILISTEEYLDHHVIETITAEDAYNKYTAAIEHQQPQPAFFNSAADETLYKKSKEALEQVLIAFFKQEFKVKGKEITFYDINLLWVPVLYQLFDIIHDGPCYKFIRQSSLPSMEYGPGLPANKYVFTSLREKDVHLVQSRNKIPFDPVYVRDCFHTSSAIKTKDTDELVAWAMTHQEFCVGALHVMPDHRRQGLAEMVLADLCKKYVEFYKKHLPDVPLSQLYFGAFVETYNKPSAAFFKKVGFKPFGLGKSWLHCNVDSLRK